MDARGEALEANFVKIAVNVMRRPGSEENCLPRILRDWFGDEAGSPGTRHAVEFANVDGTWTLTPSGQTQTGVALWSSHPRQEIAERFGHDYSRNWGQGVIRRGQDFFFFVTLEKENLREEHRYEDKFLSREIFEWQSQNRHKRDSGTGKKFRDHMGLGISIHIFVRKQPKVGGRGAPFFYCGPVEFVDWEGDQPITIRWKLSEPVPDSLWKIFQPPEAESEE